jgi:WD domain, G-beta repeat
MGLPGGRGSPIARRDRDRAQVDCPTLVLGPGRVAACTASPPARTRAGDADGTVVLFDVATRARVGQPLPSPYGRHAGPGISDINDIAFSPDGRLLATAGIDGSITLWDLARRAQISRLLDTGGDFPVTAVAFSPDGRTTASGVDVGNKVVLIRVPDGTLLHELATGSPAPRARVLPRRPDPRSRYLRWPTAAVGPPHRRGARPCVGRGGRSGDEHELQPRRQRARHLRQRGGHGALGYRLQKANRRTTDRAPQARQWRPSIRPDTHWPPPSRTAPSCCGTSTPPPGKHGPAPSPAAASPRRSGRTSSRAGPTSHPVEPRDVSGGPIAEPQQSRCPGCRSVDYHKRGRHICLPGSNPPSAPAGGLPCRPLGH